MKEEWVIISVLGLVCVYLNHLRAEEVKKTTKLQAHRDSKKQDESIESTVVVKRTGTCEVCCPPERYVLPHSHSMNWDMNDALTHFDVDPKSSGLLILIRHGQSVWNRKPDRPQALWRYAGTVDVPLSDVGIQEALEAGEKLQDIPLDLVFCSQMDRAKATVSLALSVHHSQKTPVVVYNSPLEKPDFEDIYDDNPSEFVIPVYVSPALNERNFGSLQGVPSGKHTQCVAKEKLVKIRNEFDLKFPGSKGESCKDIEDRVMPFFNEFIVPQLRAGKNVLVSSHGFVIRTLIKNLDDMDETTFNMQMKFEKTKPAECLLLAPTGVPLVYRYNKDTFTFEKLPQSGRDRAESLSRTSAAY